MSRDRAMHSSLGNKSETPAQNKKKLQSLAVLPGQSEAGGELCWEEQACAAAWVLRVAQWSSST